VVVTKFATRFRFPVVVNVYPVELPTRMPFSVQYENVYPDAAAAVTVRVIPQLNVPPPPVVPPAAGDEAVVIVAEQLAEKFATRFRLLLTVNV
jgi:hypothetical protein